MSTLLWMAWADSRTREFRQRFGEAITESPCVLHDYFADIDANMTFIAMSGAPGLLWATLDELWSYAQDAIDLEKHGTQYERLGALAELEWNGLDESDLKDIQVWSEAFFGHFKVPLIPLDQHPNAVSEVRAAQLLSAGFGSLIEKQIEGAIGCNIAHPRLGATVMRIRPFQLRMTFHMPHFTASEVVPLVEQKRLSGDVRFRGVTASFLRGWSFDRLYITFENPDETDADPAIHWLRESVPMLDPPRIVGAIRDSDRLGAQRATWDERQVLWS